MLSPLTRQPLSHIYHHHLLSNNVSLSLLAARLVLSGAARRCLTCDKELGVEMVKPTCCEEPFCIARVEEFGLGINLEMEIT